MNIIILNFKDMKLIGVTGTNGENNNWLYDVSNDDDA